MLYVPAGEREPLDPVVVPPRGGRRPDHQETAEALHHHQVEGQVDGRGAREVSRCPPAVMSTRHPPTLVLFLHGFMFVDYSSPLSNKIFMIL